MEPEWPWATRSGIAKAYVPVKTEEGDFQRVPYEMTKHTFVAEWCEAAVRMKKHSKKSLSPLGDLSFSCCSHERSQCVDANNYFLFKIFCILTDLAGASLHREDLDGSHIVK